MTAAASSTWSPDLVRLSVAWSGHRSELVLPARVPLAELLPAIAAAVEALDPEEVHRGCALVADDGQVLDPETGLREQGVRDGEMVSLVLGLGAAYDRDDVVHDDLVDAVTDALVVVLPAGGDDDVRASSLVLGGSALTGGALVLGLHHSSGPAVGAAAAALCLLLLAAGAAAARRQAVEVATLLLLAAGPYAAVAGLAVASGDVARSCLLAGLGLAVTGAAALGLAPVAASSGPTVRALPSTAHQADGMACGRLVPPFPAAVIPWVVSGSFTALVGATALVTSLSMERVVGVDLVGLVVLGLMVPRVVVPTTRAGRRLALGGVLGVDLVLAASAPVVVGGGGWAGIGLISICGLLQARRTRVVITQEGVDVGGGNTLTAVAVGASLVGPVVAAVAALSQPATLLLLAAPLIPTALVSGSVLPSPRLYPDAWGAVPAWVALTVVAIAISTVVAGPLVTYLRAGRRPAASGRLGHGADLVECAAVLCLVVLLVFAVGLGSPVVVS